MKDAIELVVIAEEEAFDMPDDNEGRFEELKGSPWLREVEEREELLDALAHTVVVSPEVRRECEKEMREAERRGWRP